MRPTIAVAFPGWIELGGTEVPDGVVTPDLRRLEPGDAGVFHILPTPG